jgi:multidrug efflux pump subunit AcrA (membrane-fusion protein)
MSVGGRRVWWVAAGVVVVVVVAGVGAFFLTRGEKSTTASVSTSRVSRGSVTTTVSSAGAVQAQQSRTLGFATTGTLTELDVKAGDTVAAGAVLARIDATSAQSAVDAATTAVNTAQDAVNSANAELAAAATPAACPSTPAAPAAPAAAAPSGGPNSGRSASPSRSSSPSCTSTSQPRTNTSSTDALLSAQQRLNNAQLTLKQANAKLVGTVITAPIAGKVLSVSGAIGTQVGSSFLVLAGTNDVVVRAQFTEAEIAHLALKQTAKITLPDKRGTDYTGTVIQIDPAGTISARLVRYAALIAFDAVPDGLLYGQSANVAVTTASVDNVLYVPSTAISDRKDSGGTVTGTVTWELAGRTERRPVELGLRGDVNTEVKSGLAAGDEVLTTAAA